MSKLSHTLAATLISAAALLWLLIAVVAAAPIGLGSPMVIAFTSSDSQRPQIAHSGVITHAVWTEAGWIVHSRNAGLSWTTPISVAVGDDPSLTVDGSGSPQLAFTALISGTLNVYHTRYVSSTWSAPVQVSDGLANTSAPDIAAAPDSSLSIVWSQGIAKQLHLARSTNGGQTWPDLGPIFSANGSAPKIAIGTDLVTHVAWQDDTTAPFRIKHTQRMTGTWSLIDVLSDEAASSFSPAVAANSSEAHVLWQQSSAVLYTHGSNLNFTAPITLSTGTASAPTLAPIAVNLLAAAWDSGSTITLRLNNAGTWGEPLALAVNPSGVGQPTLSGGPNSAVYGAFTWGAAGSRDIAFNVYTQDAAPGVPALPILIAPPNGTITTSNSINLHWQSGGGAVLGYNVDVDGAIITTSNTTSSTLLALGIHAWTVRAYNAAGYSAWAAPWTVEVSNTLPAPGTPILIAPSNGSITTTNAIELAWQIGAGGTPGGFNVDVNGSIVTTTSPISVALLSHGTYTWTVRAFNVGGYSAWAASRSFTILRPAVYLPLVMR